MHFNADKFECMRLWPNPSLAPDYDYLGPDGEVIEVKPSLKDFNVSISVVISPLNWQGGD